MPFSPIEKIKKPRILLLDFSEKIVSDLREQGYNIFVGTSGFSGKSYSIPVHESELELIFWDCSKIKIPDGKLSPFVYASVGTNVLKENLESLRKYFAKIRAKAGIATILLGKEEFEQRVVSDAIQKKLHFFPRKTTTILPEDRDELLPQFIHRFIKDEDIKFGIYWSDNLVNYTKFLLDEDSNHYASFTGNLIILPYVKRQSIAIKSLLQDVLPYECDAEIFPGLSTFEWLNKKEYLVPSIIEKLTEKSKIIKEYNSKIAEIEKELEDEETNNYYLKQCLVADDSDLFAENKKLKSQVIKMLKDLGFRVEDIDIKKKEEGKSLVEDLQVKDDDFFALVEVKGTDSGAKSNWVKKDLLANLAIYLSIHDKKPSEVPSFLIFNHERREEPTKRTKPFKDDSDLVKFCELNHITLIPIYELYKLCIKVKFFNLDSEKARELIKKPGLVKC